MKEKLNAYFEKEYQATIQLLQNQTKWGNTTIGKGNAIRSAINRCLGAATVAEEFGLSYEDTKAYDEYLAKFRKLLLDI